MSLIDPDSCGKTASTPELAKLGAGELEMNRENVLCLERTDWADNFGKPKAVRKVIVEAEKYVGEWKLGVPDLI